MTIQNTDPVSMTYGQLTDLVERIEQIPPLSGSGAPTSSTPAFHLGQRYIDTDTGDEYYCTEFPVSGATPYVWRPVDVDTDTVNQYIIKDSGAPTTATEGTVGKLYEDTTNGKLYICTAIVPGTDPNPDTYTWEEVGGYNGPAVVQTLGTSTTDVMSQKAVTDSLYADGTSKWKIRIGANANPSGTYASAIGGNATASGYESLAIGASVASGYGSLAIHTGAAVAGMGAVGIGKGATTTQQGQFDIGAGTFTSYGYNNSAYRLLTGLYDGQSAHDAATKGQLDSIAIKNAGAPTTATVGTVGQLLEDTTNGKLYQCTAADTVTPSYTWTEVGAGGSGPTVVQTTGTSQADVMSQNAVTSMMFQDPATRLKVQVGRDSSSQGTSATAVGYQSYASGNHSSAFGEASSASGASSVAIGAFSATSQQGVVAFGGSSLVTGYNNSQYRLLTGVYDGQSAHDAATYGQLSTAILNGGTTAPTTATVGAVGTLYSYVDTTGATPEPHLMVCTVADTVTPEYTWVEIAGTSLADAESQLHEINTGVSNLEQQLNEINGGE